MLSRKRNFKSTRMFWVESDAVSVTLGLVVYMLVGRGASGRPRASTRKTSRTDDQRRSCLFRTVTDRRGGGVSFQPLGLRGAEYLASSQSQANRAATSKDQLEGASSVGPLESRSIEQPPARTSLKEPAWRDKPDRTTEEDSLAIREVTHDFLII